MATRFYFPASGSAAISPAVDSMWDESVSGFFRAPLVTTPSDTALASFGAYTTTQATQQSCWAQFVSDTLDVAQTITTPNIDAICRGSEGATGDNTYFAFTIRVLTRDGGSVRGTIKQQGTNTGGSEFGTAMRTRIWDNLTGSTVNAEAGDRIVIEIGQHAQAPTVAPSGTMRFGDPTASSDFALTTNLTTDLRTWIEFTAVNLTFGSPDKLCTPGVASLTITGFAPTVTATGGGSSYSGTPGTASLTLTGFAPTVSTPRLVTPGAASLTLTAQTPTVSTPILVTPGVASLSITAFAPTVSAPRLVTPGAGSLSLTGFAPTVGVGLVFTPGAATLALTAFTPTVLVPVLVTPGTGSLTLTAFDPTVSAGLTFVPGEASLVLTAFAPTVVGIAPVLVTPDTAALTITRYRPDVTVAPAPASQPSASVIIFM